MTYPETIQYLESFINYEKIPAYPYKESLKLERIKDFLTNIDNPQDVLKCIHIAGTKGKGSTCAFIAYILKEAGYRVGLYTSPHLSDCRERIRILDHRLSASSHPPTRDFEGMISQEELVDLVTRLKPAIERYNQGSKYGPLSFFEVYTALAFTYFKAKKVDFAVLETGLGGRLDATNVVNPLVVAITPISYEHTQKLGNTLGEIAAEKAGIIKPQAASCKPHNPIVISAPQDEEAFRVIRERCEAVAARLYAVNKDIFYEKRDGGFSLLGLSGEYPNLKIQLLGEHQAINAAVAVGVIEALRFYDIYVGIDSIREGLYNTLWPGRCEVVAENPRIVLDGAQNIASARALKGAVKENFKYERLILVLGISKDKDIQGICREICPVADIVILTKAENPRAANVEIIEQIIRNQKPEYRKQIIKTDNVKEAKALAKRVAKEEDLVLVCGSLFVAGEFRNGKV